MYEVKNRIFLDFSKTQKSAVCNFLRALVKKSPDLSIDQVFDKFVEDEKYYLELNSSRFEFLQEVIDDDTFLRDALLYIKECRKYYDYKKSQQPIIDAQKEFEKKKRKFLQEIKMSKELPTKKQLSYYKSLCKRYNKEQLETNEEGEALSKLDLKNLIESILNEHSTEIIDPNID